MAVGDHVPLWLREPVGWEGVAVLDTDSLSLSDALRVRLRPVRDQDGLSVERERERVMEADTDADPLTEGVGTDGVGDALRPLMEQEAVLGVRDSDGPVREHEALGCVGDRVVAERERLAGLPVHDLVPEADSVAVTDGLTEWVGV